MNNLENTFGAWLKVVLPDSGITERDERLNVIRKYSAAITKQDLLDLVLAFYSAATNEPAVERFRSAMLNVDTSFGPKDDAELAVLTAGVFSEIFENGGDLAAAAALAILCADFGALAASDHITDVVTTARQFIVSEGVRTRETDVDLPSLRVALHSALESRDGEEAEETDASTEEEDETDKDERDLNKVIDVLANYGDKVEKSLAYIEARRAEQSDILYWLLSGRRQITGAHLKGLKKEQVVIFIAVELAKLTRQIPGPASASAILSTLLDQCKNPKADEVTLEDCIASISPADGAEHLAKQVVVHPVITPVSFALTKAEENGWASGWENAFKTQTRKAADIKYPVLKIAEQLYRELLLARALGEN
jgi:hypothetical protein